ncbi:hypothetical protein ACFL5Z_07070, partial [Planctomycetota bacterium]
MKGLLKRLVFVKNRVIVGRSQRNSKQSDESLESAFSSKKTPHYIPPNAFFEVMDLIRKEFEEQKTFFLTGAGRSGTTSCIRILGTASNAQTFSEPSPRMPLQIRGYTLGKLLDPKPLIWRARIEKIREVLSQGKIYGEKDLQTFCWLPYYRELFNPRFVFVMRDGRDVITSLMNWHYIIHGTIYREVDDIHLLSEQALERLTNLPIEKDLTEQARPRPLPEDTCFDEWKSMSRLEMLTWYWSYVTRVIQRDLCIIGDEHWTSIDYSRDIQLSQFEKLFDFLRLEGFQSDVVQPMLDRKIAKNVYTPFIRS